MDNDTTEFQMTAAVQPGNFGGPVIEGAGALLGVTVARMNDVAALMAMNSVPQTVNFAIKGDVAASFLRVNGVAPKKSREAAAVTTPQTRGGRECVCGAGEICASGGIGSAILMRERLSGRRSVQALR